MSEDRSHIRVLLVDDEAGFLAPLLKRLAKRGLDVRGAGSGWEALQMLEKQTADVVVSDVKMPGMDGLELLGRVHRAYPGTEVILLTGEACVSDGVQGIKAGAFDYLTKPVELEHLLSKIGQAFERIRTSRELARETELKANLESRMAASERLAALGTLAMGVAHEINNPLAIISTSTGWLRQRAAKLGSDPVAWREALDLALDKIEAGVDRAKRITHQLLDFARKSDYQIQQVNVRQLVEEVVAVAQRNAPDAQFTVEVQGEPFYIWSDPNQLRQVLLSLVANSLQASKPGGWVSLAAAHDGRKAMLTVKDTGEGIARENLDRIFEPFFSTRPVGQGSGLGLSVSRGIVEKLGGTIEVESRLGAGATFKVVLPIRPHDRQELDSPMVNHDDPRATGCPPIGSGQA